MSRERILLPLFGARRKAGKGEVRKIALNKSVYVGEVDLERVAEVVRHAYWHAITTPPFHDPAVAVAEAVIKDLLGEESNGSAR